MARSTDSIGAPNVLASSRAPAQADIEIIDVNSTNNVLIGTPLWLPESYVAIRVPYTGNYGGTDFSINRQAAMRATSEPSRRGPAVPSIRRVILSSRLPIAGHCPDGHATL